MHICVCRLVFVRSSLCKSCACIAYNIEEKIFHMCLCIYKAGETIISLCERWSNPKSFKVISKLSCYVLLVEGVECFVANCMT